MSEDERPAMAIGHVSLRVTDVPVASDFYETLGMRSILKKDGIAILELRGGTHILLFKAKGKPRKGRVRSFDLMVDDVHAARIGLAEKGLEVGDIEEDKLGGHEYFDVTDPDGHILTVYSTHAGGRVV